MIPTFFDLRTGKTAKGDNMSFFWWTEGNGSCDCNRMIHFDETAQKEMHAAQAVAHPELQPHQGVCFGCKRFIAIDVEGDLNSYDHEGRDPVPHTKEQVLVAMNFEYAHRLERP